MANTPKQLYGILSNGVIIPQVGLGTWQAHREEVKAAVKTAINVGYRLIDTASIYENEEAIGEAIQECIADGIITRDDIFVTTKAFVNEQTPELIEKAIRGSLERLKLEKVDLYLSHTPTAFDETFTKFLNDVKVEDIWRGFEKVYELGLAKAIGVSNWNADQVERVMKIAKTPIMNLQIELHLYFQQKELLATCKKHNIFVTSFATLGSPGRFNFKLPNGKVMDWDTAPNPFEDENVLMIAEKKQKSPAQILLRYAIELGVGVIPKSVNTKRIAENFDLFDFSLTAEEMTQLESSNNCKRLFTQDFMQGHPEDPYDRERPRY